ncbi:hypothetical protein [Virgibacillus halodenitrificans]|uniref:hypothetical protein n=1 Tax=Virgibacillus halodenitrificans TaxID=1482 RepID=UPI00045CC84A|nr:hypothetical protein [Virgibacillus halodenitrificans]CDQ35375.1 spore coat protein, CotS family [Virgibacillus halodenitrificans]
MNNKKERDEIVNRLSSFLFEEGELEVYSAINIKKNVFKVTDTNGEKYIIKRHIRKKIVDQQWQFFDNFSNNPVIPFIAFPNSQKIIKKNNQIWTIAPYIKGEHLNYRFKHDRGSAVATLKKFHAQAENIYIEQPLIKNNVIIRWYKRLEEFKKTENIFAKYGLKNLHKDIVQTTVKQFYRLSDYSWDQCDYSGRKKGRWIHGDVASHNFIKNNADEVFMIDFDLLECTSQIYDYIQLGQRFLPYINWNLEELFSYQMVEEKEHKLWLAAINVPSDLMRETLHSVSEKPGEVGRHLKQMEKQWERRKLFSNYTNKVIQ